MTTEWITQKYERESFTSFLADFLPDDFEIDEITNSSSGSGNTASIKLNSIAGALDSYLDVRGIAKKATTAYSQGMIATGTLMVIIPLIVLYLFAQKGFVESLSQTGIKM